MNNKAHKRVMKTSVGLTVGFDFCHAAGSFKIIKSVSDIVAKGACDHFREIKLHPCLLYQSKVMTPLAPQQTPNGAHFTGRTNNRDKLLAAHNFSPRGVSTKKPPNSKSDSVYFFDANRGKTVSK
jgi:hypothetical protein